MNIFENVFLKVDFEKSAQSDLVGNVDAQADQLCYSLS